MRKWAAAWLASIVCGYSDATFNWADMRPDLGTNTQSFPFNWSFSTISIIQGNWYHRFRTNDVEETFTLTMPANQPAGDYNVWVWALDNFGIPSTGGRVRISAGGGITTNNFVDRIWSSARLTAVSNFDTATVSFFKTAAPSNIQEVFLGGFFFTTNLSLASTNSAVWADADHVFRDYSISTVSNQFHVSGNLVPNSSFELGFAGKGWSHSRSRNGSFDQFAQRLVDAESWTGGWDGQAFADIGQTNKVRAVLQSPVIRLRGGREKRQYTLSAYLRAPTGGTLNGLLTPVLSQVPGQPTNSFSWSWTGIGGSWTRYQTSFWWAPSPTREVEFDLSTSGNVQVDAVQLEERPAASPYRPFSDVEFVFETDRVGNVYGLNEAIPVFLVANNTSGKSLLRGVHFEVYDAYNRLVWRGAQEFSLAPGLTTNSASVTITNRGSFRLVGRMEKARQQTEEIVVTRMPLEFRPLTTNSLFGINGEMFGPVAATQRLWGFQFLRSLSPGGIARASEIAPATNTRSWGNFDYRLSAVNSGQLGIPLLSLQEGSLPAWMVTNGVPIYDALSNYIFEVVTRASTNGVTYFEGWNELNVPFEANIPVQTAIEEVVANAVKAANPNAYYIAFGGAIDAARCSNIWLSLTPTARSNINAVSFHWYPGTDPSGSSATTKYSETKAFADWAGKPVWNSESGSYSMGLKKGDIFGWTADATFVFPTQPEEVFRRSRWDDTLYAALRSWGRGFRFILYDSRVDIYSYRNLDTVPTIWDYDDSARPDLPAVMWATSLFDPPDSFAIITNTAAPTVEAYLFGKGSNTALFVFSQDKTNRSFGLSNGAGIGQFDQFGNVLATNPTTLIVNHFPWSWFSSVLTTNQMRAAFTGAVVSARSDLVPPAVSVDVSPFGVISTNDVPVRFRWTAIDDVWRNATFSPTNVLTRYRLTGLTTNWSTWSQDRYAVFGALPRGQYQLEVQARDRSDNVSEIFSGPPFVFGETEVNRVILGNARLTGRAQ